MTAYYNDNDPFSAAWLAALIKDGLIPNGHVDNRSVLDVQADDLAGYTQCHFFAGIGGWPYAFRLAGWPDDQPVWSGSCPCQPLSSAGQRRGHADERHLWPAFHALIEKRTPPTIFGEQVAGKNGREWLAGIRADLEHLGYAVGAADLCAASAGAPHIRQRLYWVADNHGSGRGGLENAGLQRPEVYDADGRSEAGWLADAPPSGWTGRNGTSIEDERVGTRSAPGFWSAFDLIPCTDGKARRTQPGLQPLAHGVSGRVGRLRGYGNAIVPQVAATFMRAWMEASTE